MFPGVPLILLARRSPVDFPWKDIGEGAAEFKKQGGGHLVSLVGSKEYFSGANSSAFYLGRDDAFSGRLLIANLDRNPSTLTVRAFLNYLPIELAHGDDPASSMEGRELRLGTDQKTVLPIELRGVPWGTNDLTFVLLDSNDLRATPPEGTPYPLLPRRIFQYQLRRGDEASAVPVTAPLRSAPELACPDQKKLLLARDTSLAVVNCTSEPGSGVFFGGTAALFYEVPPHTVSVYAMPANENTRARPSNVFHVSSPFAVAETWLGRPTFSQSEFLGI
jgi:hypothetical protein